MSVVEAIFGFVQDWATSTADKTALWLGFALLFICIYFAVIWFLEISKSWALLLAYVPVLILDTTVSFGTYVFKFPLGYTYSINKGVMSLNIVDFIFGFGIFKRFGLSTFNEVNGAYVLTGMQTAAVWVFMYADTLFEFLLIFYFLYQIFGKVDYAAIGAAIPTIGFALYLNPIKEMAVAKATVSHTLYFFDNSTTTQVLIVGGTALVSFLLVVLLLSTTINIFISTGKRTVRPGLEASGWETNFTGVAFMLAVLYSVANLLHPEFAWYTIIPGLIFYGIIKSTLGGYAEERRAERREDDRVRRIAEEVRR